MSREKKRRAMEQQRIKDVIHVINKKAQKIYATSAGVKESVIELRKNFWDDVTVNLDEPDDVIETHASMKQQAELLSERERTHGQFSKELQTLKRLKDSPYFGRVDFKESSEQEADQIYIGIASLMDESEEEFLVYDWRAPISSLYYDFSPGKAAYETVEEIIEGEMTLKRQFIIRQGELKGMFDTGVTIGDRLLQEALGNNASTQMKSIVATIQAEQNKIIRNERSGFLIVQGAAGSGKTSAALQRIAYLMYRYRNTLNADNMVLFSPNPLFSSYVANVLPELGEENIKQTTFLHFLEESIGKDLTIESPFEQMEYVLAEEENDYAVRMKNIELKSGLEFKQIIDAFVFHLKQKDIHFKNITFQNRVLVSKEEQYAYFYRLEEHIRIPNKMELISRWLLKKLRKQLMAEKDSDWVMEKVELLDKETYLKAYYRTQDQDGVNDIETEEAFLRKAVVNNIYSKIKKRILTFQFVNVAATYQRMFADWKPENLPAKWEDISNFTVFYLSRKHLMWEDAAPYAYFRGRLLGHRANRSIRQLVIDEAQDYTAFQFAYIKEVLPYTRMTLLGDVNQGIYAYATKENPLTSSPVTDNHERITLTKSYRSTKEIVEFTKSFAPGEEPIEPFNREGDKPKLIRRGNADLTEMLLEQVKELRENGSESIALICKTKQESNMLFELLEDETAVKKIDEETYEFHKGLLIVPVYLAKGIEFDAVIIPDVSEESYDKEADRTLFYTACTRAMHALVMVSTGEPCRFIGEAPDDKYIVAG